MNIAIYGGTFNPIHFGHIGMALYTLTHTDLDQLWLMVTPGNPLKDGQLLARNEQDRLQNARQAISQAVAEHSCELGSKQLLVSDFEFTLPRPSFTAQTLQALQKTYPQHQFTLLIGEDNLRFFKRWRNWQWIAANFPVIVYPRNSEITSTADNVIGSNRDNHSDLQPDKNDFLNLIFLRDAPLFDISSTQIRAKNNANTHFSLA